jgi:hypothetical protein
LKSGSRTSHVAFTPHTDSQIYIPWQGTPGWLSQWTSCLMQVWASYLYSRGRSEIIFLSPKLNLITLPKLGKLPCNICQIFLLQNHQIWSIHTMNFQRKMHIQTHQKGTSQSGVFSIGIFGGKYIYKSTKCRRGFRAFFPQYYRYKSQEKRGRYAGFSIRKTMVQIARNVPLLVWNLLQKYSMRFPKSRTFATVILGRKYTCKVARFAHAPAWWDNPHLPRVRGDWKAMNTKANKWLSLFSFIK